MSIDVQTEIRNTCLYKGGPFAVLMAMADCANTTTGEGIYPGIDLLAANARLEIRATQENIKRLRADGVVKLVGPDGDDMPSDAQPTGGRGRKTEYRIDLERVHEMQGLHEAEEGYCQFCEAREKRRMLRAGKGAFSRTKGAEIPAKGAVFDVKGAESGTHIRTHEPSLEPSIEPDAASPPPAPVAEVVSLFPDFDQEPVKAAPKKQLDPGELEAAFAIYDQAAEKAGWAAVSMRTEPRRKALTNRLKEAGGIEGWRAGIERALASDFCCGKCPPTPPRTKPFKADFDFLTQQSSFVRLMEGKYDNAKPGEGPAGGGGFLEAAARIAARRASGGA